APNVRESIGGQTRGAHDKHSPARGTSAALIDKEETDVELRMARRDVPPLESVPQILCRSQADTCRLPATGPAYLLRTGKPHAVPTCVPLLGKFPFWIKMCRAGKEFRPLVTPEEKSSKKFGH